MPDTFVYPLSEFYAHAQLPLPPIQQIESSSLPEPYRTMLVHQNDMTPTLEGFHRAAIHLEVFGRERRGGFYYREVVLRLDGNDRPVEFGANKIYLGRFDDDAQDLILGEEVPLGTILARYKLKHKTEAKHFLRVEADALMAEKLELSGVTTLYGRKAVLTDPQGRPLSEVVEILPPVTTDLAPR